MRLFLISTLFLIIVFAFVLQLNWDTESVKVSREYVEYSAKKLVLSFKYESLSEVLDLDFNSITSQFKIGEKEYLFSITDYKTLSELKSLFESEKNSIFYPRLREKSRDNYISSLFLDMDNKILGQFFLDVSAPLKSCGTIYFCKSFEGKKFFAVKFGTMKIKPGTDYRAYLLTPGLISFIKNKIFCFEKFKKTTPEEKAFFESFNE